MPKQQRADDKLARSRTVTVRLDPKLHFAADLASRIQRRTLSSYIESAVAENVARVTFDTEGAMTVKAVTEELWDVDATDRFVNLALRFPDMLTHDEQVIWKLVRENGSLWRGSFVDGVYTWDVGHDTLDREKLRLTWPIFLAVAAGRMPRSQLPTWTTSRGEVPF